MPGSVQNAAPLTVLPASLSRAFVHEREYPVLDREFGAGTGLAAKLSVGRMEMAGLRKAPELLTP